MSDSDRYNGWANYETWNVARLALYRRGGLADVLTDPQQERVTP